MDFIERALDEIVELLNHAIQDCTRSREIFAQIRVRLQAIEERYNRLVTDYQELQNNFNAINRLNGNELARRNQELNDLRTLLNDLTNRLDELNNELNARRQENNDFITRNVAAHINGLLQQLAAFIALIQNFLNRINGHINNQEDILRNFRNLRPNFDRAIAEIINRRNILLELENERNNHFNRQQLYIQDYQNYLEERENFIRRNENVLNNFENNLNRSLREHANDIHREIEGNFNGLNARINLAVVDENQIDQILENIEGQMNDVNGEIERFTNGNQITTSWEENFLIRFLLIFFAGYILNLCFFGFISFFKSGAKI
ncbi:unnamed protein product [Brachionus calyciflorus]|uniref:Uncharacterized protein n=1 Tax=Brachionus calyciflorus TaxID=104777 RepID=A0A814ELP3_9BILA|nr:unnamed protein product [Brachionus calyciflorus]